MKTVTLEEASTRLPQLCEEVRNGGTVVLKNGDEEFELSRRGESHAQMLGGVGMTQAQLEAELLKAIDGPFTEITPREIEQQLLQQIEDHRSASVT